MQRAVALRPSDLQPVGVPEITWLSPQADDDFAEYRDGSMLDVLGLGRLQGALTDFWPARGPQWDALGQTATGPVLVEAKAHIGEFLSPPSSAGPGSLAQITAAFQAVQAGIGIVPASDWTKCFYQLANRLAHLWFFRSHGVDARLLLVNFVGCDDMKGPRHAETWLAAEAVAFHALGVPRGHEIMTAVHVVHPDVTALQDGPHPST